jgi:predicted Fe-Mo cluster-binding NifX family protein
MIRNEWGRKMIKKVVFPCFMPGGLASKVSMQFGRSEAFTMVTLEDEEIKEVEVIQNFTNPPKGGAGVRAVKNVKNLNPSDLVLYKIGPNAFESIHETKIKIYGLEIGEQLNVKQALDEFKHGKTSLLEKANAVPHPT